MRTLMSIIISLTIILCGTPATALEQATGKIIVIIFKESVNDTRIYEIIRSIGGTIKDRTYVPSQKDVTFPFTIEKIDLPGHTKIIAQLPPKTPIIKTLETLNAMKDAVIKADIYTPPEPE